MTDRKTNLRKWMLILISIVLAGFALQYAAAQSSGPRINLNSPVSFPVDI